MNKETKKLLKLFGGNGWVLYKELHEWLKNEKGIEEVGVLKRDNMTDGEYHRRYQDKQGATFDLHGNVYDASSFEPLISWADEHRWTTSPEGPDKSGVTRRAKNDIEYFSKS